MGPCKFKSIENAGRLLHLQMYIPFHNDHFNELVYEEINLLSLKRNSLEIYFLIAVYAGVPEKSIYHQETLTSLSLSMLSS